MRSALRPVSCALLACLLLAGCTSLDGTVAAARAANDAALEGPLPADAWIVIADGEAGSADADAEAFAASAAAAHGYVFRAGEQGDRALRMAYLPASGVIAGRAFAAALGLELSRGARSGVVLRRDTRRLVAGDDAAVAMRIGAPDGSESAEWGVVLDPDFDGALLVSPAIARALGLRRFEIPGRADVHVALGRPFAARRARVHVMIAELDVAGLVEAIHPADVR